MQDIKIICYWEKIIDAHAVILPYIISVLSKKMQ